MVLRLEWDVVVATSADVAGERVGVGAPRGLSVTQIIEGLGATREEAVQDAVAVMEVDTVLL